MNRSTPRARSRSVVPWALTWGIALVVGATLAFAASTQAKSKPHAVNCRAGYVRRLVRVPERKHGKIVRRHGKIVYKRVPACVKVSKPQRNPVLPSSPTVPSTTAPPVPFAPIVSSPPPFSPPSPSPPPPSPPPTPSPPVNTALPKISGTTDVGSMLTASTGSWTNGPTSYGYQWRDCASGSCTNINGATSSSYTLQSGEAGDTVDVQVTANNNAGSNSATSSAVGPVTNPTGGSVVVAAGDIACPNGNDGHSCKQSATEGVAVAQHPNGVFVLGDNQYDAGAFGEYQSPGAYNSTWGLFGCALCVSPSIVHPVPGNHEYGTSGAGGYFQYFGQAIANPASTPNGYYSFDIGSWHIIALNSDCSDSAGCGNRNDGTTTAAQVTWLTQDLAAHRSSCTLAMWHHPLFSSGWTQGSPGVAPLWNALYSARADVVLGGHDHLYERFAAAGLNGSAAPDGIREFVVGTGGESLNGLGSGAPNAPHLDADDASDFGVLRLTLFAGSYSWAFISTSGRVVDSGSANCHGPSAAPASVAAATSAARDIAAADVPALIRRSPRLVFAARPLTSSLRAVTERGLPLAVHCSRKCDVLVRVSLRHGRRLQRIATFFETDEQIPKPYSTILLRLPAPRLAGLRKATLVIHFSTRDAANHHGVLTKTVQLR
jgi:hypothetical protein